MEEKVIIAPETVEEKPRSVLALLKILYKNLVLIVMMAILFGLMGYGYAHMKVRTVHTASYSMILRMDVGGTVTGATAINNASLAKIYVEILQNAVKSSDVIEIANDVYNQEEDKGKIYGSSASVSTSEKSFIFKISYSDYDKEQATEKLDAVIVGLSEKLPIYTEASDITLIKVQNGASYSSSNGSFRYIVLGAGLGAILAVAGVFIKHFADNTVKDKDEFEEATGVTVWSHLGKKKK